MSTVSNFLAQNIQGYNVTTMAEWVSQQSVNAPIYGSLPIALILDQWGWESQWGGADISTYFNPGNQIGGCGYGNVCGLEPNGQDSRFCSIEDGVKAYAALIIYGYPHVMAAYANGGFNAAATALGQGYYAGYTGGAVNFCTSGSYGLTSPSTARIWASGEYGSPPGSNLINSLNSNSCLQALNYAYVSQTNPLPAFGDL